MTGIYKITSPTGKIYVGQSVNINTRKKVYAGLHCKKQKKLYASILKYGWDAHTFEVVEECSIEELNDREIFWISFFDTLGTDHGMNLKGGGSNGKLSEEVKRKISVGNTGRKRPDLTARNKLGLNPRTPDQNKRHADIMKGRKHSEETKEKMSIAATNRVRSDEMKKNMSESAKKKVLTPEHKAKLLDWIKSGLATSKKVVNTETGEIYLSCKVLANTIGVKYDNLKSALNGRTKNKTVYRYL